MHVIMNTVQARRIERRLSQQELADRIGCSQPYLSKLERGLHARPAYAIVAALAKVLRCSPDKLFPSERVA